MIVAIVLIVGGAFLALRPPRANLVIGLLEVTLGIGLLKLHPAFRIATLTWLGILMGLCGLNAMLIVLTRGQAPLFRAGVEPLVNLITMVVTFTLAALGYRILKRPAIQALFYRDP